MSVNAVFNGVTYSIPNTAGESGWTSLTDYLVALAANTSTSGALKQAIRVATSSPVTVSATDATIVTDLTVAGAVAISLPAGTTKQILIIVDGKGDAGTNNITLTGNGGQLINGSATFVMNANFQGVILQFDGAQWRVLVNAKVNAAGGITNVDISANAAIALSKLASVPSGEVLMGDGSNKVASYTVGGDVTISPGGVAAIVSGVIVNADINAAAAIAGTKLANTPSGNLAATTVQGALNELQTDVDTRATSAALTTHISTSTGLHGVVGAVVGTTDAQTLTNKTLNDTSNALLKGGNTSGATLDIGTNDGFAVCLETNNIRRFYLYETSSLSTLDAGFVGTAGLAIPSGTTAQRPSSSPVAGTVRYNSSLVAFEGLHAATWRSFATLDGTETLTNKTLTSPVLTTPRVNTYQEVQETTSPAAPSAGYQRLFAKADGNLYRLTSAGVESPIGGGSSSGVNVVPTASQNGSSGWLATNATLATDTTASNNPLSGVTASALSVASSTSGGYASLRWTMPAGLQNRPLNIDFWAKLAAASDYKVELYYNAASNYGGAYTRVILNSDVSGVSNLNGGSTQFRTFFVEQGQSFYELRLVRTAASAATAYFSNVSVGVQPQVGNGFAGTDWQAYTPTLTNFGTTTSNEFFWRRVGDSLEVQGRFVSGTTVSATAAISVPTGLTIGTLTSTSSVGRWASSVPTASVSKGGPILATSGGTTVAWSADEYTTAIASLTARNASAFVGSGDAVSIFFRVPITGWSSNVTMADRALESYAADDGTNDVFGPNGALVPNVAVGAGTTSRPFNFPNAAQATNLHVLEYSLSGNGSWSLAADVFPYGIQNARQYGVRGSVTGNTYTVEFGNGGVLSSGVTFGADGAAWSTQFSAGSRFRVRQVSGGAAVGFPISTANLVGRVDGLAPAAGMLGEQIRSAVGFTNAGATGTYSDITSFTLTAGVWDINAGVIAGLNGATMTAWDGFIGTVAGNNSTGFVDADNDFQGLVPTPAVNSKASVAQFRVTIATSTIYYVKCKAVYSAGTPRFAARISAVRVG